MANCPRNLGSADLEMLNRDEERCPDCRAGFTNRFVETYCPVGTGPIRFRLFPQPYSSLPWSSENAEAKMCGVGLQRLPR